MKHIKGYPYNGNWDNIYGICGNGNKIICGSSKYYMDAHFKPIIPNNKMCNISIIVDYRCRKYLLVSFEINGKQIGNKNYTFKINGIQ